MGAKRLDGKVMSVEPNRVVVGTREGPIIVDRTVDATAYRYGDRVAVINGVVVGRRRRNVQKVLV